MRTFELFDPLFLPHAGCEFQLSVNNGDLVVLVGENGIGKSTLLQHLYSSLPSDLRSVVEQKGFEYFYDRKLGELKNIFLSSAPQGLDQIVFHQLWKDFGLGEKEGRLLSHLSGGETQCLKLCLGLTKDAEIFFLDEPSQYLDSVRKSVLIKFLENLNEKKKIVIMVEHNREWLSKGTRVVELKLDHNSLKTEREWIM